MGRGGKVSNVAAPQRSGLRMDDVKKHDKPTDAYLCIHGKVYDVTQFEHPGGNVIFTYAGADATDVFAAFHSKQAYQLLDKYCVGKLDGPATEGPLALRPRGGKKGRTVLGAPRAEVENDFRALRREMQRMGLFNASRLYYVWKVVSTLAWAFASFLVLRAMPHSWTGTLIGALLLAVCFQQSGWLTHDFLHHQVFENRLVGDMIGIVLGNVVQGFSVNWWKDKHNTHHAVPNVHESKPGMHDGDPDIDTMPLLAWSTRLGRDYLSDGSSRLLVKLQKFTYFPILLLARLSWVQASVQSAFFTSQLDYKPVDGLKPMLETMQYPGLERAGIAAHYAITLAAMAAYMTPLQAIAFFLVSQCTCGILLAIPFGVGHNGMAVYDAAESPDFYTLQVSTTRNVHGPAFVHWFMGGLSYQLEHHLFPMMPRHNLPKAAVLVKSLCKKHGIPYHSTSLLQGTIEILDYLDVVAKEVIHDFPAM